MQKCIIVAVATNGVIGHKGSLPWRLKTDLEYFKKITVGNAVIMGRHTWESLPAGARPLPHRCNIVVSQLLGESVGCHVRTTLSEAFALADRRGLPRAFVIGGERLFRDALPIVDALYLTSVFASPKGDRYFREALLLDSSTWVPVWNEEHYETDRDNEYPFQITVFERMKR